MVKIGNYLLDFSNLVLVVAVAVTILSIATFIGLYKFENHKFIRSLTNNPAKVIMKFALVPIVLFVLYFVIHNIAVTLIPETYDLRYLK